MLQADTILSETVMGFMVFKYKSKINERLITVQNKHIYYNITVAC